jgi:hypothetical protein
MEIYSRYRFMGKEVANFKGAPRTATASFSNGNKGFIVKGRSIINPF